MKEVFRLRSKIGLEVGGPSAFLNTGGAGYSPVYAFAKRVDGVNFSTKTVWEGDLKTGRSYKYYPKKSAINLLLKRQTCQL